MDLLEIGLCFRNVLPRECGLPLVALGSVLLLYAGDVAPGCASCADGTSFTGLRVRGVAMLR